MTIIKTTGSFLKGPVLKNIWKVMLVVMLLLATHVHHHAISADTETVSSDCVFCHAFGHPIVGPSLSYVLLAAAVWFVWVVIQPRITVALRQYEPLSRGPPATCLA